MTFDWRGRELVGHLAFGQRIQSTQACFIDSLIRNADCPCIPWGRGVNFRYVYVSYVLVNCEYYHLTFNPSCSGIPFTFGVDGRTGFDSPLLFISCVLEIIVACSFWIA